MAKKIKETLSTASSKVENRDEPVEKKSIWGYFFCKPCNAKHHRSEGDTVKKCGWCGGPVKHIKY
jgi:hypothetical protein